MAAGKQQRSRRKEKERSLKTRAGLSAGELARPARRGRRPGRTGAPTAALPWSRADGAGQGPEGPQGLPRLLPAQTCQEEARRGGILQWWGESDRGVPTGHTGVRAHRPSTPVGTAAAVGAPAVTWAPQAARGCRRAWLPESLINRGRAEIPSQPRLCGTPPETLVDRPPLGA